MADDDIYDLDRYLAQQKVFNAWMAEFPEPKRMTHTEIDQMIRDKVGDAHPDTMANWIYHLKERLGVVIDYSDDEEEEEEEDSDDDVDVHTYFSRIGSPLGCDEAGKEASQKDGGVGAKANLAKAREARAKKKADNPQAH